MQSCSTKSCRAPLAALASRRSVLIGIAVAALVGSCAEQGPDAGNDETPPRSDPEFLKLSRSLTGHDDLNAITAARLAAAFAAIAPDVHRHFGDLARLHAADPQALLAAAATDELKFAALAIVAAWYTGSLGHGSGAITVAYRDALMQRPVADAMLPPTYARGGPGWWTAAAPEVGNPGTAGVEQPARTPRPKP